MVEIDRPVVVQHGVSDEGVGSARSIGVMPGGRKGATTIDNAAVTLFPKLYRYLGLARPERASYIDMLVIDDEDRPLGGVTLVGSPEHADQGCDNVASAWR